MEDKFSWHYPSLAAECYEKRALSLFRERETKCTRCMAELNESVYAKKKEKRTETRSESKIIVIK